MDDHEGIPKETVRQRAERLMTLPPLDMDTLSPEAQQELFHELQVHQIELEIQNEELRRLQVELEESRARYFDLYDLAPVGYVTLNKFGLIMEANLTFCNMLGVTRKVLGKRPLTHFILPADQDIFYKNYRQLLYTEEPQACQLRLKQEDGGVIWTNIRGTLTFDDDNTPICRATIGDITKDKQTENALRESEEIFCQFMEHSPIFVFFKDKELRSIKLSKNYEQLLGKPLSELLGKTMDELFPSELAKSIIADDLRILEEGKSVEIEEELKGRLYTTTKFPIEFDGQLQYLAGYTVDITERKQAEAALLESNHTLEKTVDDLRQTQARLVEQERLAAVGQLAAGIAHDFNNILAIITLHTDLGLQHANLSSELRTDLTTISQQTRRAAHLVEQILDFGNRALLRPQLMDLAAFLGEQVDVWRPTIPQSIKIVLSNAEKEYLVTADTTRIQHMFLNLVINARDAMPEGGELHLNLERLQLDNPQDLAQFTLPAGNWVRISLRDTGTGILPEALPHIFEPFFTTKEPGRGSGLGLAQVYGIVKQHEGHVDVQTEVGKGTTFTIYLPSTSVPSSVETAVPPRPELPQGHGETILIVDDNVTLCSAVEAVLDFLNYQTLTARNGREALAILEQDDQAIALILSDLIMPEMDGEALLQAVKERGLVMPFVMMSGHPLETEIEKSDELALNGWLLKPIDMQILATTLAQILSVDTI